MFKKKFHGGLKVLLLLLFIMLLGFCSTSYATTNMSDDAIEYLFDCIFSKEMDIYNSNLRMLSIGNSYSTKIALTNYDSQKSTFVNYVKNNVNFEFNKLNSVVFVFYSSSDIYLNFVNINNSHSNTLPFLYLQFQNTSNNKQLTLKFIESQSNTNSITINRQILVLTNSSGIITYGSSYGSSWGSSGGTGFYFYTQTNNPYNIDNYSQGLSNLEQFQGLVSFMPRISIYSNYNGQNFFTTPQPYNYLSSYSEETEEPDNPDNPDNPGGTGNTGTITNPSGDITGQIDLSGIENGINGVRNQISGDTTRIIENQNQNTTQIVNAINNSNDNYWGSSGDLDGEQQEDEITENLNNMMSSLSGDLSNNEVYQILDVASSGFLDLFKTQHDDEYYDLKFDWNDFEYQGKVLIPAGSINISQMCRDNEKLGYLQSIVRIIFNFEVSITLIYQIWNLILSTLGIDNPYLYENYNEVEKINGDTGEVHSTFYKRFRIFKRKGG